MPVYNIGLELPNQITYKVVFEATDLIDCRNKIILFLRSLGVADNIKRNFEESLQIEMIPRHVCDLRVRISELPPANVQVQVPQTNDIQIICNELQQLFNERCTNLTQIRNTLARIKRNHEKEIRDAESQRNALVSEYDQQIRTLSLELEDKCGELNRSEQQRIKGETDLRTTRRELETVQNNLNTAREQVRERVDDMQKSESEIKRLESQIKALEKRGLVPLPDVENAGSTVI